MNGLQRKSICSRWPEVVTPVQQRVTKKMFLDFGDKKIVGKKLSYLAKFKQFSKIE